MTYHLRREMLNAQFPLVITEMIEGYCAFMSDDKISNARANNAYCLKHLIRDIGKKRFTPSVLRIVIKSSGYSSYNCIPDDVKKYPEEPYVYLEHYKHYQEEGPESFFSSSEDDEDDESNN